MPLEIRVPHDLAEQIMAAVQPKLDAALSVAGDVQKIVAHYAIIENQDVNGDQMPKKKPRPKGTPKNYPNIPLVQNDTPDEMNPDRWNSAQLSNTEAIAIYGPPEHHEHLVNKDPADGGRKWITQNQINPNAQKKIEQEMIKRAGEV